MKRGIEMNYAEIKEYDIANGPGVRMTLFVSFFICIRMHASL